MKRYWILGLIVTAAFAAEGYKVTGKIKIGGQNSWDYATMDSSARRLYVSHGNSVEVVDVDAGKVIGTITDVNGVHGIAIAPELNKGFISSRGKNAAIVFDLKTLAPVKEVKTGTNPDAICYEPKTKRVFTFNGGSKDATAIDAKTDEALSTFAVGGKPEFCAADGSGKMYANIEDTSEVVEIDAAKPGVTRRVSIAPCDGPSGLAMDKKDHVLFSVCGNKTMAITDYKDMKVIGTAVIGSGPDAAGFDAGLGLAFSSNGRDATLTIVKRVNGKWQAVDTVPTERGARTMAVDEKAHKVYLLAAEYPPPGEQAQTPPQGQKGGRGPQALPDSYHVLVVGR